MKTILYLVASACIASAQTNTNPAPVLISFTNTLGIYVTNAEVVKFSANKLIYRTDHGLGGGTIRLEKLPPDLQAKFNYDPDEANKADQMDADKKAIDRQKQITLAQQAAEDARWDAALKMALKKEVDVSGNVIQKIDAGLLLSWPGRTVEPYESSVTILLADYPHYATAASEDSIFVNAFPVGLYSYTTVNKSENTIHVWTCSTNRAVQYYLTH